MGGSGSAGAKCTDDAEDRDMIYVHHLVKDRYSRLSSSRTHEFHSTVDAVRS